MADDSSSQTVQYNQTSTIQPEDTSPSPQSQDQQPSTPIVSEDHSAGSEPDRPISTNLADSEQTSSPGQSAGSEPDRPISTNLADSPQTPLPEQSANLDNQGENKPPESPISSEPSAEPEAAQSANLEQTQTIPADSVPAQLSSDHSAGSEPDRPVSFTPTEASGTILADSSSGEVKPDIPVDTQPTDSSSDLGQSDQLDQSFQPPPTPTPLSTTPPSNPSDFSISSSQTADSVSPQDNYKDVGISDNQALQAQSGTSEDASGDHTEISSEESANIKPEPLESPQITLNTPPDNQESGKTVSFGDILAGKSGEEPAQPAENSQSTQTPSVTFGDLIKDIDYSSQVVPEAERPVGQQQPASSQSNPSVSTVNNQQPATNNLQTIPSSPPNFSTTPSPQTPTNPPEPVIIEKPVEVIKEVVKEVPVVDQGEVQKQFEEKSKAKLVENRLKANLARSQKKKDHLDKILELAGSKRHITNQDVRDLLHVSQSSATNYLAELVSQGLLKIQKRAKSTFYTF